MNTDNENEIPYIQEADEYQAFAIKTMSADYQLIANRLCNFDVQLDENLTQLIHASFGIQTEAGEFADPLKKFIFYGKAIDYENMREELGDLIWYIAIAAEALETSLSALMTDNIQKLAKRYPEKIFTENDAITRADKMADMSSVKSKHVKCPSCNHDEFSVTPQREAPAIVACKKCGQVIED